MKKHSSTSGPNGVSRIRSLLAFRHQNPVARLVSMIAVFAMAMLLVGGTGAAYADDTAPTDTSSTEVAADATPTEEAAPAEEEAAPAEESAPTEESAPEGKKADATVAKALATIAAAPAGPGPLLVGNATCEAGTGTLVGGFQIDGDPCDEGGLDFENGTGSTTDDLYQVANDTIFSGGDSENDDPQTWGTVTSSVTGKADIGTFWAFSHTWTDDHVYAYFGFTNDSTSGGTQDYSLEYNQAAPANGMPVRTVGDLLFHFFSNGSDPLVFEAAYI